MSAQPPVQSSPQSLAIAAYFNERRAGKCEFEALLIYHSTYIGLVMQRLQGKDK